ncbi:hypothetical protein PVAP13_2KG489800, partial [Panicum virgatum]
PHQQPRHREARVSCRPRSTLPLPLYKALAAREEISLLVPLESGTRNRRGSRKVGRGGMVFFCFLVDQRRTVRSSKPAAGICSRCGGCASVADMETATRVCYLLTVHRRTWRAIICTFCGAMLKSYRHYRLY